LKVQTDLQDYPGPEHEAWIELSEDVLAKTRDNSDDDVFNGLFAK